MIKRIENLQLEEVITVPCLAFYSQKVFCHPYLGYVFKWGYLLDSGSNAVVQKIVQLPPNAKAMRLNLTGWVLRQ